MIVLVFCLSGHPTVALNVIIMSTVISSIFLSLLIVTPNVISDSSEEEEKIMVKCMEEAKVKREELKNFRTDEISDKMLCFMKCRYENDGVFDENGKMIKEIMQEAYDDFGWNDEQRNKADGCLDNMKPVKECGDLEEFFRCLPVINFGDLME
nr:odorant binding protein [Hippodamia variegata]